MTEIFFLGSADALKPVITLKTFLLNNKFNHYKISCFTNGEEGRYVNFCRKNKINVVQTGKDILNTLQLIKTEDAILVSVGWPKKIDFEVLRLFNFKTINCHGSYLPDYRGSRAYMHYWANCEKYFGATIHYMNENFDDGKILIRRKLSIASFDTPTSLHYRTAELCGLLLLEAIPMVLNNELGYEVEGISRYFKKLSHLEFEKYHEINIKKSFEDRILTPHKLLK